MATATDRRASGSSARCDPASLSSTAGPNAHLARDIDVDAVAFPVSDQLLLPRIAVHEFFDEFYARILEQLRIGFEAAVQGHRDRPGPREHIRVLDGHFVTESVVRYPRKALHHVGRLAIEVTCAIEPVRL